MIALSIGGHRTLHRVDTTRGAHNDSTITRIVVSRCSCQLCCRRSCSNWNIRIVTLVLFPVMFDNSVKTWKCFTGFLLNYLFCVVGDWKKSKTQGHSYFDKCFKFQIFDTIRNKHEKLANYKYLFSM